MCAQCVQAAASDGSRRCAVHAPPADSSSSMWWHGVGAKIDVGLDRWIADATKREVDALRLGSLHHWRAEWRAIRAEQLALQGEAHLATARRMAPGRPESIGWLRDAFQPQVATLMREEQWAEEYALGYTLLTCGGVSAIARAAARSAGVSRERLATHDGITCDGCGMVPILGERFTRRGGGAEEDDRCAQCYAGLPAARRAFYVCIGPSGFLRSEAAAASAAASATAAATEPVEEAAAAAMRRRSRRAMTPGRRRRRRRRRRTRAVGSRSSGRRRQRRRRRHRRRRRRLPPTRRRRRPRPPLRPRSALAASGGGGGDGGGAGGGGGRWGGTEEDPAGGAFTWASTHARALLGTTLVDAARRRREAWLSGRNPRGNAPPLGWAWRAVAAAAAAAAAARRRRRRSCMRTSGGPRPRPFGPAVERVLAHLEAQHPRQRRRWRRRRRRRRGGGGRGGVAADRAEFRHLRHHYDDRRQGVLRQHQGHAHVRRALGRARVGAARE